MEYKYKIKFIDVLTLLIENKKLEEQYNLKYNLSYSINYIVLLIIELSEKKKYYKYFSYKLPNELSIFFNKDKLETFTKNALYSLIKNQIINNDYLLLNNYIIINHEKPIFFKELIIKI